MMARDGTRRKKRFPFLKKTRSDPHLPSETDPTPLGQSSRGWVAKTKDFFTPSAGRTPSPNPSQQNSASIDAHRAGEDSAQLMAPEEGTDKLPSVTSAHADVSLTDPSTSHGDRNVSTSDQLLQEQPAKLRDVDSSNHPDQGQTAHGAESDDFATHATSKPDSEAVDAARLEAREAVSALKPVFGPVQAVVSGINNAGDPFAAVDNVTTLLKKLKTFNSIVSTITEIHPYAKATWGVLSVVSKTIISQTTRDDSISQLLLKMDEVYTFLTENDLAAITSMKGVVVRICQQTLECSYFLRDYSKSKNFWIRLGRNVISETDDAVKRYNTVFDDLMQQFRDRAARDTAVVVHRILEGVQQLTESVDLSEMKGAKGAGLDTRKKCLPGTREDILDEITAWINDTADDAPRVFWLHGNAGTGKSAIAHTIADRFRELGRLGSCFCFDRTQAVQRRHEKVFTTIARGLADRDEQMRHAIADIVHHDNSLTTTPDIVQQWKELIMKPASKLSGAMVGPTLIAIEALDESGDDDTRQHLLRILAGKLDEESCITNLPHNFRILLTSRPLPDIHNALGGVKHVRQKSMDSISSTLTERDILEYVTNELSGVDGVHSDDTLSSLAVESGGLFEWARLACAYIKGENDPGLTPRERFEAIISHKSGEHVPLLDQMYKFTLKSMFPQSLQQREKRLTRFCSVMAQVLGTLEPLPLVSLRSMRGHFHDECDPAIVTAIVKPMGALLSGTIDPSTVVRPLHASFSEFLTDKERSGEFFVNPSLANNNIAFASLGVMEHNLRFNICRLPSSYLPNSEISDLDERVKQRISPELSYSCRFWTDHLGKASFNLPLADAVRAFFNHERLLFWFEVLSLLKMANTLAGSLSSVIQWVEHADYQDIADDAMDAQKFIRNFGFPISFSTPHLYLSALPFSPKESRIFTKFANTFPLVLQIASGHNASWPVIQHVLHADDDVFCATFSPNGKRIVSGSSNGTIDFWDAETGERLWRLLKGHENSVNSIAFSPDGKRIVSGSDDRTIRLWDAETGESLRLPLKGHHRPVTSVAFSPDGKHIVSGSWDETVRLWGAETGEALRPPLKGHQGLVNSVSFSPDGKRIASGSEDKTIRLWDAETGESLRPPLEGHTSGVNSVAFSPDGKHIVSGSDDHTIRLWDTETGEPVRPPLKGHKQEVKSVTFSLDGKRIVSGSEDDTIRLWAAETGEPLRPPFEGHTSGVNAVAFSPDGKRIMSGSWDGTIRLWDVETSELPQLPLPLQEDDDHIISVAFSLDGKCIASGLYDGTIQLRDAKTGKLLWPPLKGHTDRVNSVAFSPDSKRIVSGSEDKTVRLWDAETGEPLRPPLEGHEKGVKCVAFSPDGKCIASGDGGLMETDDGLMETDGTIRLWDAETGELLRPPLIGHEDQVKSVAFSPDGKCIVSGSYDKTIRLWDARTGEALWPPLEGHEEDVLSVAFSPDGKRIVSGSWDDTIRLWNTETGELLRPPLKGHMSGVMSVAFSRDGKRIVSGSYDNTIRLWDGETGEPLWPLLGAQGHRFLSVAFSPDGQHIVSGSLEGVMQLWDVATSETQRAPLEGHMESVGFVAVHSDGTDIVSRSQDRTIYPFNALAIREHDLQRFIRFSIHPGQHLVDTTALIDDITAPAQNESALPVRIRRDDRWTVIGPKDRLLFWVPPTYNPCWYDPRMWWITPALGKGTPLDLSDMAHGLSWESCYRAHADV